MYNFESIDLQTCFYMRVTYYFVVTCLLGVCLTSTLGIPIFFTNFIRF